MDHHDDKATILSTRILCQPQIIEEDSINQGYAMPGGNIVALPVGKGKRSRRFGPVLSFVEHYQLKSNKLTRRLLSGPYERRSLEEIPLCTASRTGRVWPCFARRRRIGLLETVRHDSHDGQWLAGMPRRVI
jgi:hypothetical protein